MKCNRFRISRSSTESPTMTDSTTDNTSVPIEIVQKNLLKIASHITQSPLHLKIVTENDIDVIKESSFLERLSYCFYSTVSHKKACQERYRDLAEVIDDDLTILANSSTDPFFDENKQPTQLFSVVQSYNQAVARNPTNSTPLKLFRNSIQFLNPVEIEASKPEAFKEDLKTDKPESHSLFSALKLRKITVLKYPGDHFNHGLEAMSIFLFTQAERIGALDYACIAWFLQFLKPYAQKWLYRSNGEQDTHIYAKPINPISLCPDVNGYPEGTSYWCGHASVFMSIPLKSDKETITPFNIITDPVEGDLNSILYPRQTNFALPVEQLPATHVMLLSHNHLDHYSEATIRKLFNQRPIMIVPPGDKKEYFEPLARKLGVNCDNVIELNWWEQTKITFTKDNETYTMDIIGTPSNHWAGQGFSGNESGFLGYVIRDSEKSDDIYFAGDTARLNEDHIRKLRENFNIKVCYQPGGPDERRKDMKSTHQASVDGLLTVFQIMLPKITDLHKVTKKEFMEKAEEYKLIYMHTMTFKLGNLHLDDTYTSVNRVIDAIEQADPSKLKDYELEVYNELMTLSQREELTFEESSKLTPQEVASLLRKIVFIPKIGSKIRLRTPKSEQIDQLFDPIGKEK